MNKENKVGLDSAKNWVRKHPIWSVFIGLVVLTILLPKSKSAPISINDSTPTEVQQVAAESKQNLDAAKTTVPAGSNTPPISSPQKTVAATESSAATPPANTTTDRENAIAIIKANASKKWGTDYEMVNYTVKNQTVAYDWVVKQTQHLDIMTRAKTKWSSDYEMIKYTYENQVAAYNWVMSQTEYPAIMTQAKQKWGGDYEMVKYEYENQVAAYEAR